MNRESLFLSLLLAALCSMAQASTLDDLERTGEQFDALESEVLKLQERSLARRTLEPSATNLAHDYLNSCGNVLTSVNREIVAMTQVLHMSQFIWDPSARELAKPYLDIQIRALVRRLNLSVGYLEKILHRSGDDEVAKVCLRTRDLVKASIPVAAELRPAWNVQR
jgi:hypothetical protein